MKVYRISRFTVLDQDKLGQTLDDMRASFADRTGAEFIDFICDGEGNGMAVARYPNQGAMDAATPSSVIGFDRLIEAGMIKRPASLDSQSLWITFAKSRNTPRVLWNLSSVDQSS